jgi:hypothetical protein
MKDEKLAKMRASLTALTNSGGVDPGFNSVEVDAKINKQIVDSTVTFNEIENMIPKESLEGQFTHIWRVRTTNNDSTSNAYSTSESGSNTNTPGVGAKVQLTATARSSRTDWEVENFFLAGSSSSYNAVADEIADALNIHMDEREKEIINGADTGAYGKAGNFQGMKQLVDSYVGTGDTTTVFGIARASGKTYLDAQYVDASAGAFTLSLLDKAITAQKKVKGKAGFFLMSHERRDEINSKLQAQQRFAGNLNLEGGFTVSTYQGIPIIGSSYADKLGASDTDTRILLIAKDNFVLKQLQPTQNVTVDLGRSDSVGGFIKDYQVLVCKDLTKNVLIDDIAVPSY